MYEIVLMIVIVIRLVISDTNSRHEIRFLTLNLVCITFDHQSRELLLIILTIITLFVYVYPNKLYMYCYTNSDLIISD